MRILYFIAAIPSLGLAAYVGGANSSVYPSHFASAANGPACTSELDAVQTAIATAQFTNEKDRESALKKLAAARIKVSENKPADAAQKLTDIRTSTFALISSGKLVDNAGLIASLDAAVACVNAPSGS